MEEVSINLVNLITSYGALGAVAAYFMIKDYKLNKSIEDTLHELTVAIKVLIASKGGSDEL